MVILIHNIVMPPAFRPEQWSVIDDACWLVFRLFGVNIRPRLNGVLESDRPWEGYFPWICHELHEPSLYTGEKPARQPRTCALSKPGNRPPPRRGHCISGLIFRTIHLPRRSGFAGYLVLGPFLESPPTPQGLSTFYSLTGVIPNETARWAYMQSPVLPPKKQEELIRFCLDLFASIGRKMAEISEKAERVASGVYYESIFPPLRLGDDFPLHVYGLFLTYWKIPSEGTDGKPGKICDFEYVDMGKCRIETEGSDFVLERGQALLTLPGQKVRMTRQSSSEPCELISVSFHSNSSPLVSMAGHALMMDSFQQTLFSRLCSIAVPRDDKSHRDSMLKMLLAQILMGFREIPAISPPPVATIATPANRQGRQTAMINSLKTYIDNNLGRAFNLKDLADIAKTSVPTVLRLFKRESGTTPGRYHIQSRIKQAEQLLRQSMLSIGQIGEQLGFSSGFHFSNSFKKETGISPSDFARSARSTRLQIERANTLLREKKLPVEETSNYLGFTSVEDFRISFRHYTGVSPEDYAEGKLK